MILHRIRHRISVGGLKKAVHYDVAMVPDTPKSLLREVMVQFGRKHYPNNHPAFDGRKNLYSPGLLPFGQSISDTITVEGDNKPRAFKVDIKFAREVDLTPLHDMLRSKQSPQDALQCLDIVLRNAPSNTLIIAGRCFFSPPRNQIIKLGDGMEMYYGFYQSAIRGWSQPLLNVDVAHKAFPIGQPVLDLICDLGSNFRTQMTRDQLKNGINNYLQVSILLSFIQIRFCFRKSSNFQQSTKRLHIMQSYCRYCHYAHSTMSILCTDDKYICSRVIWRNF